MLGNCFLIILIYVFYSIGDVTATAPINYGAFNLSITAFDICKGPKQKDCATSFANISSYYTLQYEVTVHKNTSPTQGKILATSNGKEFLRLQVKKTCEHLFLRPLLGAMLNATSDCVIRKGHYKFAIDIQTIARSYFGGTFVFGNWTFKSVFYSNDCNFSCSTIKVIFFPLEI